MRRTIPSSLFIAMLAACAAPTRVAKTPVPPPAIRPIPPAPAGPANPTDEAATQRWLQQEIERQTGQPAQAPPAARTNPTDEAATQQWLQQQTGAQQPQQPPRRPGTNPTDEGTTNQWLQQEAERVNARNPERPPEPVYQVVEQPVYVDRPVYVERWHRPVYVGQGYDSCGEPVYYPAYRYHPYETPFPVNTVLGAGIGAIIGHQSHHQARGAWIGGAIGFLADLGRWYR